MLCNLKVWATSLPTNPRREYQGICPSPLSTWRRRSRTRYGNYKTVPAPPQYILHCTTTINNTAQPSASWIWTHIVYYWHRTGADQQNHRRDWGQQRVSSWASLSLSNKSTTPWYLILRCIYASCFNEWGCLAGVPAAARCVVPHCQSFKPASRVLLCVNIYGR